MPTSYRGDGAGKYGTIPTSELEKKWEVTQGVFEDDEQLDQYYRDTLRDFSPSPPTLESDLPRSGLIDPRTGEMRNPVAARTVLTLHHTGHLSGLEPDHSEAFFELTDREPRGTAIEPDFRKLAAQSWIRGYDQNFRPDDDASVPESGRGHRTVAEDIRAGFYAVKDRMKIFDTSKDNFVVGILPELSRQQISAAEKAEPSAETKDIANELPWIRRDATTVLSNLLPVGYSLYTTPSMQFQVAKYAVPHRLRHEADITKARHATTTDQSETTLFQDTVVPPALAYSMATLVRERQHRQSPSYIAYGTSYDVEPRPAVFQTNPFAPLPSMVAEATQPRSTSDIISDQTIRQAMTVRRKPPSSGGSEAKRLAETMVRGMSISDESVTRTMKRHGSPDCLRRDTDVSLMRVGLGSDVAIATYPKLLPHTPIHQAKHRVIEPLRGRSRERSTPHTSLRLLPEVRESFDLGIPTGEWGRDTTRGVYMGHPHQSTLPRRIARFQ